MARGLFIGVDGKARKVKGLYMGVSGVARKVKKLYIGVNGVARLVWQDYVAPLGLYAPGVGPAYGTGATAFYFKAQATGGAPPYTYRYYLSRNEAEYALLTGLSGDTPVWNPSGQTGNYKFRITVTDSEGTTVEYVTPVVLMRRPAEGAFNLTLSASRDAGTGIATWTLASTSQASRANSLVILKDGVYYLSERLHSVSALLTEPGVYTAIGAVILNDTGTAYAVTGGAIEVQA